MSGTITRGKAIRGDLALWDGVNSTASRPDATGGTTTGLRIGNEVDVLQVYGAGSDRSVDTIRTAIAAVGDRECTFTFAPGNWAIASNLSIPANIACEFPRGAVLVPASGVAISIAGPVLANAWQIFNISSGGTVATQNLDSYPEWWGAVADGAADDTSALRAAYRSAAAASILSQRPVRVMLRPGSRYRITSRITIEGAIAGITTVGYGAQLLIDEDVGDAVPALHFGYEVADSLTPGTLSFDETLGRAATTTATVAISKNSRTVTVASTAGMEIGMPVTISSSGEYFFGITDDSGNNPRNKSEMNRIRQINSATVLTLDHFPEDDYSITALTVTVSAYHEIKNIHFVGLEVIGNGDGDAHADAYGPEAIRVEWCQHASFRHGVMRNFNYCPWRDFQCTGVDISHNHILGRDPEDATNGPTISIWFYGPGHHGSCYVIFAGNVCRNLRRPQDLGPIGATTVARHIVQANNNVTGGQNGIGAHMCQYVTAVNNEITDCVSGYFYRAKDITIRGGNVRTIGTNASDAIVVLGSTTSALYTEEPDLGTVVIDGLKYDGRQNFCKVSNGITGITITGCRGSNAAQGYFLWTVAKSVRNVKLVGNHHDSAQRVSGTRYGVYIQNDSTNPMTVLDGVDIQGNTFINGAEGIRIDGANANTAPAANISIRNNTFPACSVGAPTSDIRLGESGFYDGATIQLGPNNHWSTPSNVTVRLSSNSAVGMHRYRQMPKLDSIRNVVGYATSSALANRSWSNSAEKATFTKGMRVINSDADATEYSEWIITSNGTFGTITGATTGSITSGTAALTLNDNSDDRVFVGAYITIAGAGAASADLLARVTAVNGTAVTLDTNASTTVAGAAVSYTTPTIKGVGLIET